MENYLIKPMKSVFEFFEEQIFCDENIDKNIKRALSQKNARRIHHFVITETSTDTGC